MKVVTAIRSLPVTQIAICLGACGVAYAFTIVGTTEPIDSFAACAQAGYTITDTNPPLCQAPRSNFLGTPRPTAPPSAPSTSVAYEILVDGDTHAQTPSHDHSVIDTLPDWQKYWSQAHSSLPALPPIIPVDFTTSSIITASLGEKPNSGYGLKITSINSSQNGSLVDITESTPTITCPITQIPTNRYLIVRTPKLTQPVTFHIDSEMRHCP